MLKALWHNQQRHAGQDGSIAEVSLEEAETAVSMAAVIAHWLTSGLVTKDNLGFESTNDASDASRATFRLTN
ncbi:hypothetical protein SAMN04489812_1212 [Microlunatus soli]|uniref:Uncharacterized protein n=2 Tax=Microlunatus soli TaxID=630515 RepID=A0A1H1QBR5_9ACTN|nr:hypothetical protein SAMN04489812_1212 [Microlunatus soli]